jgi:hypothetical protein
VTSGEQMWSGLRALSGDLADAEFSPDSQADQEDHEAHAVGETCPRCHRVITATDDVRRTATGEWVHESC